MILAIALVGLVGYFSFRNGQQAVNDVSRQLRNEITGRIQEHLESFLQTPHQITAINQKAMGRGLLNLADPKALTKYFLGQLDVFKSVTSIYFGYPQGGLADSGREGAEGARYVITTDSLGKGPLTKYAVDQGGGRSKALFRVPEFDAAKRPWYRRAVAGKAAVWSPVYVLSTGQDMAIAASRPVYDHQKKLLGVMSVDLFLSHLSYFLKHLKIGKNGIAYIVERSGLLIATSTDEALFARDQGAPKPTRLNANQSEDPLIRHSMRAIQAGRPGLGNKGDKRHIEFRINGEPHHLQATPMRDRHGLDWEIVVVIPEADFLGKIETGNKITMLLIAAALVLALMAGWFLAHRVTRPIWELNSAAQSLARGEKTGAINKSSRIMELSGLVDSFNLMSESLQRTVQVLKNENAERKQAQEALKTSERLFRNLVENLPFPVVVGTADQKTEYANPKFSEIFGYTVEDIPDVAAWREKFFPDPAYRAEIARDVDSWRAEKGSSLQRDRQYTDKWGKPHEVSVTVMRFQDRFYNVLDDVTELKKAEAQLRQAQRMEALGTLAGGIAHDFNNILAAILGYSELALDCAESPGGGAEHTEQVIRAALRARDLVQRILTFSRKIDPTLEPVDLNGVIAQTEKMLLRAIPKMVHIEHVLATDLRLINADSGQMTQLLMNLCGNANDAMPEGGRLTIETANITLGAQDNLLVNDVEPGDYARLTVSDTGHGMDRETLEHIFDPFFTRKEVGRGTGLGLASVYGIVKNHGGHINCQSELGRGTTFTIYLPVARDAAISPAEPEAPAPAETAATEATILLVDDEESLRGLGKAILSPQGFTVLLAEDGEEALEIYGQRAAEIDLIILDINMPGMGGHKCLEEILSLDPLARVIIASGYSSNGHLKETLGSGAADYISKPFQKSELIKIINQVLQGD